MSQQQSEISMVVSEVANTQKITVGTTHAQTAVLTSPYVVFSADVDCFVLQGQNPTALADGTCHPLPANTLLRLKVTPGNKLSLVAASAGTAYITPGA